jgi:hypothetical protein
VGNIVTFRVSKTLKERMDKLRHINWSELLRATVERTIDEEERKLDLKRDRVRMKRAVEEMDRLARLAEGSQWIGAEEAIRWRRKRYSYLTQA